jgi:hypothetical protein
MLSVRRSPAPVLRIGSAADGPIRRAPSPAIPHHTVLPLACRSGFLPLPLNWREPDVKNVQRNARIDSRLGIYLIALVMIVIVLGYWIVVANR